MDRLVLRAAACRCVSVALVLLASTPAIAQDKSAAPPELKLSTAQSPAFPLGKAGERWAQLVNDQAARAFEVKLYPGATLAGRDPQREFSALRDGAADLAVGSALAWSGELPAFGVFSLPWLAAETREQESLAANAVLRERIAARAAAAGVVVLTIAPLGERMLATAKGAVLTPADLVGLRVRATAIPLVLETLAALGARPTAMSFAAAQAAFASGELDGQEAPATTLAATRAAALGQKYVTRWGAFNDAMLFAVRRAVWERWSDDQRSAVRAAALTAAGEAGALAREDAALAELTKQGVTLVRPTSAQRAVFRAAAEPVWVRWTPQIGQDIVDAAEASVAPPK